MRKNLNANTGNTPAQKAEDEQAAFIAYRRRLHTWLMFWRLCELKVCKRARGCRGDVHACNRRFMPLVPAELKALLYKTAKYMEQGLPAHDAERLARADMAKHHAARARLDADAAEPVPEHETVVAGAAADAPARPSARIRST